MPGRITQLGDRARARSAVEVARARAGIDRHRDRPLVDVALTLHERDGAIAGAVISSAIAFRLFLFFVPLLLLGVGIVSQVAKLLDPGPALRAAGVGGAVREQIRAALDRSGGAGWVAIGLGLFGAATAGRTLSKTAVAASALAWRLPVRAKAPTRIVGSLVGLLSTMGLVAAVINRVRVELGAPAAGASFAVAVLVYVVAWMFVLALLPRATTDPGAVLPGALLVAGVTALLQLVSQLYLPGKIADASDLYGAFGATVVTLGWLFALGRAIVLGMVLNAVVHERVGTISASLFSLPLLRALPRRYAEVRRYFGLDEDGSAARRGREQVRPPHPPGDHPDRMMTAAAVAPDDDGAHRLGGSAMADVQVAHGPIDFVLIEFDADGPADEAAAALLDLVDAGVIRLYDLVVVRKTTDGQISGLELNQSSDGALQGFSAFSGARSGLIGDDDLHEAAGALEPGSAAALIVYENAWAVPFITAARAVGGEVVASERLPAEAVLRSLEEIEPVA